MKDWEKRLRISKAYGASPSTYVNVREEAMETDRRYTAGAVWDLYGDTILLISDRKKEDGKCVLRNVILMMDSEYGLHKGASKLMEMGSLRGESLLAELRGSGQYHFHFGDDLYG